jgi:hypothetical protein
MSVLFGERKEKGRRTFKHGRGVFAPGEPKDDLGYAAALLES